MRAKKQTPKPYEKHPLWKAANARMEQGGAAITVRNQIVRNGKPKPSMVKAAGLKQR